MKSDADIMAESLLRGGKMLARACPSCGSPLFEVKGETSCVVCAAHAETARPETPETVPELTASTMEPTVCKQRVVPENLEQELRATIVCLLKRVQTEPDPERCRTLLKCVTTAWDLLD